MTKPTTPPPGPAAGSHSNLDARTEALRLAVKTAELAPCPDEPLLYAHLSDAVVFMAERYRVFLEGGAS